MHAISSYCGNRPTNRQGRLQYTVPQLAHSIMKCLLWNEAETWTWTWTFTQTGRRRLEAFEMWMWRRTEKMAGLIKLLMRKSQKNK